MTNNCRIYRRRNITTFFVKSKNRLYFFLNPREGHPSIGEAFVLQNIFLFLRAYIFCLQGPSFLISIHWPNWILIMGPQHYLSVRITKNHSWYSEGSERFLSEWWERFSSRRKYSIVVLRPRLKEGEKTLLFKFTVFSFSWWLCVC